MSQPIGHSNPFAGEPSDLTNQQKAAYLTEFDTVTNGERAIVFAQLAAADAIREQTAVFRQLLDEDRAAARDLAEKAGA